MHRPLIFAALVLTAGIAVPTAGRAAPAGCVKPATSNAVTVVAPGWSPVVGTAVVGSQKKKDGQTIPGDAADTKVADASDRCPAGYVQQYFQQPATRPIQYESAPNVVAVTTASPNTPAKPAPTKAP